MLLDVLQPVMPLLAELALLQRCPEGVRGNHDALGRSDAAERGSGAEAIPAQPRLRQWQTSNLLAQTPDA